MLKPQFIPLEILSSGKANAYYNQAVETFLRRIEKNYPDKPPLYMANQGSASYQPVFLADTEIKIAASPITPGMAGMEGLNLSNFGVEQVLPTLVQTSTSTPIQTDLTQTLPPFTHLRPTVAMPLQEADETDFVDALNNLSAAKVEYFKANGELNAAKSAENRAKSIKEKRERREAVKKAKRAHEEAYNKRKVAQDELTKAGNNKITIDKKGKKIRTTVGAKVTGELANNALNELVPDQDKKGLRNTEASNDKPPLKPGGRWAAAYSPTTQSIKMYSWWLYANTACFNIDSPVHHFLHEVGHHVYEKRLKARSAWDTFYSKNKKKWPKLDKNEAFAESYAEYHTNREGMDREVRNQIESLERK